MSDDVLLMYSNREVLKLVFRNTDTKESVHPYQLQWTTHRAQASSSSSLQNQERFAVANVIKPQGGDNGRFNIINNPRIRDNLECPSSKWMNFPMFSINRKIETIMAQKRSGEMNEQLSLSESSVAPYLIEFASESHRHQQQNITKTDKETRPYESEEGLACCNCHKANMTSSLRSGEENDLFSSGVAFKEHFANANLAYLKRELCHCYWTRLKDVSSSCPGAVTCPCLTNKFNKEREIVSVKNKYIIGASKSNKLLKFSTIKNRNGEAHKCSNAAVYANVKETAFFEKFTLPTKLNCHGGQEENRGKLVSSTNNMEGVDGDDTDYMVKENESMVKTDIMHIDVYDTPSSPEVGSSFKSQKVPMDVVCPNLKKTEIGDGYTFIRESTQRDPEQSQKWVKRLHPNKLDLIPLGTKRFKIGDPASSDEMQNLLIRVANYNKFISELPKCQQQNEESEKLTTWIQRWCRSSQEAVSSTLVLCEPENSKVDHEKFEAKQFPSLAAMALMGRRMNDCRPCEFQKRGSAIVWSA